MLRILLLASIVSLAGCNGSPKKVAIVKNHPSTATSETSQLASSSDDNGTTGCYIHTAWSDFQHDADADGDAYRQLTPDELSFFRAVAAHTNGWDGLPVGDGGWIDHHISKKDPTNPHSVWTVAFTDGNQVCSTMKVDADIVKLLSEIYVDDTPTR